MRNVLWSFLAAGIAVSALADAPPPPAPIAVHRTSLPITLDGKLDDPAWKDAATIDRFYETSPADNTPPKVKTQAWITYDDRYFYIGVRCDDPDPSKIRAPFVERDNVIGTDDNIAVLLDPRNTKRSALELRVNPRGIQGDAIYNDANGNEDFSPDVFYDTAASIDAGGWSAEFRIPFSSLRYPHADPQTWNILIWRNYPREFRYAFQSAPLPRDSNCYICHAHPLTGLTQLPDAGHLVVAPYVTGQSFEHPRGDTGTPLERDPLRSDTGVDVKYNPSADATVDLTLNPDFSQVEADVAQITVNQRFAVFFPEKRPFFLEGFDLFDTPIQVAYTRTITAPRWGLRSTGKVGDTAYTLLVAQDRGGGLVILPGPLGSSFAPQDFKSLATIGRVRHDIGSSYVGAVLTDREVDHGGHNRVLGPDFQWRPNDSDAVTGELLYSQTTTPDRPDLAPQWTGRKLSDTAATLSWNHLAQRYDWLVEARQLGNQFRADLGFVPQVGYREYDAVFGLRFFSDRGFISALRTSVLVDRQTDRSGDTIFQQVSLGATAQGRKNLQASFFVRPNEKVLVGNTLLDETYGQWTLQWDPSRRFPRITLTGRVGDSIDFENGRQGHGTTLGIATTVRPLDRLTFDATANREWLSVDGGRLYTANVERLKTTYSFSAKSIVRVITQYVSTSRSPQLYSFPVDRHEGNFLGSILYSYKLNWQTVLFLGYGDDRLLTADNNLVRQDRSLFFKVSYALQR